MERAFLLREDTPHAFLCCFADSFSLIFCYGILLLHQEGKIFKHILVLPVVRDRFHFPTTHPLDRGNHLRKIAWIGGRRIVEGKRS